MRLDLSTEQVKAIVSSLKTEISSLERDSKKPDLGKSVEDIVKESIVVKTAVKLYLEYQIELQNEEE